MVWWAASLPYLGLAFVFIGPVFVLSGVLPVVAIAISSTYVRGKRFTLWRWYPWTYTSGEVVEVQRDGEWVRAWVLAQADGTMQVEYCRDKKKESNKPISEVRPTADRRRADEEARTVTIFPALGPLPGSFEVFRQELALKVRGVARQRRECYEGMGCQGVRSPHPLDPAPSLRPQVLMAVIVLGVPFLGAFSGFYNDASSSTWTSLYRDAFDVGTIDILFDFSWIKVCVWEGEGRARARARV